MSHIRLRHRMFSPKFLWIIPYLFHLLSATVNNYSVVRSTLRVNRPEMKISKTTRKTSRLTFSCYDPRLSQTFYIHSILTNKCSRECCTRHQQRCTQFICKLQQNNRLTQCESVFYKHSSIQGKRNGIVSKAFLNICSQLALLFIFEH